MTIFLSSMLILGLAAIGAQFVAYNAYLSKKGRGLSHSSRVQAPVTAN